MRFNAIYITLLLSILTTCSKKVVEPDPIPSVLLSPSSLTLSEDQTGTVSIDIEDFDVYIFGVSLQIVFDSSNVSLSQSIGFEPGDFFGNDMITLVEADSSVIHLALTLTQGQNEIRGSGSLGELTFVGNSPGNSAIDITPTKLHFYDSAGGEVTIDDLEIQGVNVLVQ